MTTFEAKYLDSQGYDYVKKFTIDATIQDIEECVIWERAIQYALAECGHRSVMLVNLKIVL